MTVLRVLPTSLCKGTLVAPPSKSHAVRAILYASLASGESQLKNLLESPDIEATVRACRAFGATIEGGSVVGIGGKPRTPDDVIDVGNSGLALRFMGAVAALAEGTTVITGDPSIRERRPAAPLLDGLNQLGAVALSTRGNGLAPLMIKGLARPGVCTVDGADSQPVSALLTLAAQMPGVTEINVRNPGEKPWVDLTLWWLKRLGVSFERRGHDWYRVQGAPWLRFDFTVPGDFSSAAFPLAAGALFGSVTVSNLDHTDPQGDKELLTVLRQMGADVKATENSVTVSAGELQGVDVDVNSIVDAIPILSVLGCYAKGETRLYNGAMARLKESDRIHAMTTELKKMGADIRQMPDGLVVRQSTLKGASVHSQSDHRIAMALSIAALGAYGETIIDDTRCIAKTYPTFVADLEELRHGF